MRTRRSRPVALLLLGAGVVLAGCSTAVPTENPEVMRLGESVLQYKGPELEAVLSHKFASLNVGADWLILDLALTGSTRESTEVERDTISVRTPSGEVIPLATQEEFAQAYGSLAATIARANIASDPLDYWSGRVPDDRAFFVIPGEGLSFPSVWVNDRRVNEGKLFFAVPTGVQEGSWELRIDLPESKVRIPFVIGTT